VFSASFFCYIKYIYISDRAGKWITLIPATLSGGGNPEGQMYLNYNKLMNVLIISIISLMVLITLLLFTKISKKPHPYYDGADIRNSYAPYTPWEKAH